VGNAEEWVADWWSPSWASCGEACLGINPKGPCGGGATPCKGHTNKTVRGGSWFWGPECATGIRRRRYVPNNHPAHHFGFRCAADAGSAVKLPNGKAN
jgi:formylglycine-generating enzyme required for sulfatase activity